MDTITLTFGTSSFVNFSVSSTQNNYEQKNLLPIVMEENGPSSYKINIFGADNLGSVFPVFKPTETSFFRFTHGIKCSPCIKVSAYGTISSFPFESKIYGLEVLNKTKQELFEKYGGHDQKTLTVWFAVDAGEDECGIYFTAGRTETDSSDLTTLATIALNNSSKDTYEQVHFKEPEIMHKRTFNFCFKKSKMMDNLYLE